MINERYNYNILKKFGNFSEYNKYQRALHNNGHYEYKTYENGKEVVYGFVNVGKEYKAAPIIQPPLSGPKSADVPKSTKPIDIFTTPIEHGNEIDRLFSLSGLVYKFNRGIIMFGPNGEKVEDIFDGTSKHHANRISEVARDSFGIDVPFLGTVADIQESMDAASKGLSLLLLEGNMCQIYLPENVNNNLITEMIKEIEPREDFIFYVVRGDKMAENLMKDDIINYLNSLYVKEEKEENNRLSRLEYIKQLILYTTKNKISIYDYYQNLANNYLTGNTKDINDFEFQNPFLTKDDITRLLNSTDPDMPMYFATQMNRVIELNLEDENLFKNEDENSNEKSNNDSIDEVKEELEEKEQVTITSINKDLFEKMDGFALIREDRKGIINIYGYDHNDESNLKGKTVSAINNRNIQSGYYINITEFINNLKQTYQGDTITFITPKNDEVDFDTVMNTALKLSHDVGLVRFGKNYANEDINDYKELENRNDGKKGKFKGMELEKGYYVNKDILENFFGKLKIKVTTKVMVPKTYTK